VGRIAAIGAVAALALGVPGSARPAAIATPMVSFATMFSDSGDYIGGGLSRFFVNGPDVVSVGGNASYLSVGVSGGPYGDSYSMDFAAPPGQKLHPGLYTGAQRAPFRETGHPGIDISGSGRGCNTDSGRFDVKLIGTRSDGSIARLWLTYEQHCEGGAAALFGEVRIGLPAPANGLLVIPTSVWWPDVALGAAGKVIPVTLISLRSGATSLTSSSTAGVAKSDFVIRSDECAGQSLAYGDGCQVLMRFVPHLKGPRVAQLVIPASSGQRATVQLDGFGIGGRTRLVMTSDPGDYIGQGQSWSYTTTNGSIGVGGGRNGISAGVDGANGDWWYLDFYPSSGDILASGSTYQATRYPFNYPGAGMDISGNGRGCNTLTGQFTVNSISVGLDGALRYASISFTQHCEGGTPALRGTLDYRVPTGDLTPPGAVAGFAATRSSDRTHATLHWTNPSSSDYAYTIVRGLPSTYAPGSPNGSVLLYAGRLTTLSFAYPSTTPLTVVAYAVDTAGNVSAATTAHLTPS
jgi:hypothetical protein